MTTEDGAEHPPADAASRAASDGRLAGHGTLALPQLALAALFVTALVTSQVVAAKVLAVGSPVALPLAGSTLLVPAAVFAYALTFFASDCYAELYGERAAHELVNVAFLMNFVLLGLVWLAIAAPVAETSQVGSEEFAAVLGPSGAIVAGSLLAYLVSQNWDVFVFHRLREVTDGDALWLRNVASTATSQLLDTLIFIAVGFVLLMDFPLEQAAALVVGQYAVKLLIALGDTPLVYLVVRFVRSRAGTAVDATPSD